MEEKPRILIVDDDAGTPRTLRLIFENKGYQTETAETGREAIKKARERFFNAALLDIRLPDMEGVELIAPLKQMHPDMVVIMVTAYASLETAVRAMNEGASGYIEKPFNMDEVLATLMEAIEKQCLIAENRRLYQEAQNELAERRRAEKALKEYSERLEEMIEERTSQLRDAHENLVRQEKLAVLGQLAGGVAHELRNPLGAVKNAAYFLNMALEGSEPEVEDALKILRKELAVLERVISDLLDYTRPKQPSQVEVDVNELIQKALSHAPVSQNIEVLSQLDEVSPPVLADPDQLVQAFGNLVLNAIQAMPEGGRLVVRTSASLRRARNESESQGRRQRSTSSVELSSRPVEPPEEGTPGWVLVSFTDTGVGVPEENLVKVFEPLFTTKARGIGLGLSLVKTLVEAQGGTIDLESEVGKGSTFTVKLPVAGAQESKGAGE